MTLFDRLAAAIRREERALVLTVIEGERAGARVLVAEDGSRWGGGVPKPVLERWPELLRRGRNGLVESAEGTVFAEVYGPPPRLVVVGAVDTTEALCKAAKLLGWRAIVTDARRAFATPERLPSADEIVIAWPGEAIERIGPDHGTAIVVVTHDEKFDVPALVAALATEAFYIGALGSRRNQEGRRRRLLEAGVQPEQLARIAGPCGLDVGATSQPETAISIVAEILAVRADRDGGRLARATGRIHGDDDVPIQLDAISGAVACEVKEPADARL
jgi:xanthine dehydrogenase accessory factor